MGFSFLCGKCTHTSIPIFLNKKKNTKEKEKNLNCRLLPKDQTHYKFLFMNQIGYVKNKVLFGIRLEMLDAKFEHSICHISHRFLPDISKLKVRLEILLTEFKTKITLLIYFILMSNL